MPPHGPKHHPSHHRHHHHARDRSLSRFVDRGRIDRLLTPWVADDDDRAFALRCLLDEGPAHHRGVNYILLALLGELSSPSGGAPGETAPIPLRLPPHLRDEREHDDDNDAYPLPLPLAPLRRLANDDDKAVEAMVECLTDGPPQHSLANAAMLLLIEGMLRR